MTVVLQGDDETVLRQCYEGVERDGEVIRVRDTVLLRSGPRKKSLPYVAKISALWEDPRTGKVPQIMFVDKRSEDCGKDVCCFDLGELMMSLFWYYRPEHTQGGRDPSMHCEVSHCLQLDTSDVMSSREMYLTCLLSERDLRLSTSG